MTSLSPTLSFTQEKQTTVFNKVIFNVWRRSVSYHLQEAQGSQTGSQGSQPGAQCAIANFAFMPANSPPNGRNLGAAQQGAQQDGSHGLQIGSHGLQAIGSHGLQATGTHGSQPGAQ